MENVQMKEIRRLEREGFRYSEEQQQMLNALNGMLDAVLVDEAVTIEQRELAWNRYYERRRNIIPREAKGAVH